jgi:nucleoprotein TPR
VHHTIHKLRFRFARREKEIAETKGELAQNESLRYQQRCTFLEKQLEEAQKNLKEEKTQTQVEAETSVKHAEVMEKVQKLNELTHTNKVLMDEKQTLEQRTKAMEAKVWNLSFLVLLTRMLLSVFMMWFYNIDTI